MKKISVVIPVYNEEQVINECIKRITQVLEKLDKYENEIIIIDDGSRDNTLSLLEEMAENNFRIKILSFSRNFGHQAAVTAGLKHVTGDAILIIDADL